MKLLKTFALIAWIAFLSLSLVSAAYWVWSNVVTVSVTAYQVTLSAPTSIVQNHIITLEATLSPAQVGMTIEFGKGTSSSFVSIGTNTTNSNGKAMFEYNVTENSSISFVARYSVP